MVRGNGWGKAHLGLPIWRGVLRRLPAPDHPGWAGQTEPVVPEDVERFGQEVAAELAVLLGEDLIGAYFVGSIALGGYVADESDLDILAIVSGPVPSVLKLRMAESLLDPGLGCPARGLEFNLYRSEVLVRPPVGADFEVSINGGTRMERKVVLDASSEPGFWYVLDRAIAHRVGVTIVGPPPAEVIADVGRPELLEAMLTSMRWHRQHEKATLYSVLNAARAWRFADENVLGSKLEGAEWARRRWLDPTSIDAAVELRRGRRAELDPAKVDELTEHVEGVLRNHIGTSVLPDA